MRLRKMNLSCRAREQEIYRVSINFSTAPTGNLLWARGARLGPHDKGLKGLSYLWLVGSFWLTFIFFGFYPCFLNFERGAQWCGYWIPIWFLGASRPGQEFQYSATAYAHFGASRPDRNCMYLWVQFLGETAPLLDTYIISRGFKAWPRIRI